MPSESESEIKYKFSSVYIVGVPHYMLGYTTTNCSLCMHDKCNNKFN